MKTFREYVNEGKIKATDLEVAFKSNYEGDADIMKDPKTEKYYYWNPLSSKYIEIKDISGIEKDTKRYTIKEK